MATRRENQQIFSAEEGSAKLTGVLALTFLIGLSVVRFLLMRVSRGRVVLP